MNPTAPVHTFQLSHKPVQEFALKSTIYGPGQPCSRLYLVLSGRVLITNFMDGGGPTVTRIVGPNGLFGEAVLGGSPDPSESAEALDTTCVMSWSTAEIEDQVGNDPATGLALVKYFVQRCEELNTRVEAAALYKTSERIMLALLQLTESLGTPIAEAMRMEPLTHEIIAGYVGTSREIVTAHLNLLRRAGLVTYSRKHFDVNVSALRKRLQAGTALTARGAS